MKRFRYLGDPLFLGACALYVLNRWGLKPRVHSAFLHGQFNDLLLIPAALPPLLWLQRRLALRGHDAPPTSGEIIFHLAVWTLLFELMGPRFIAHATGDWRDILAYAAGALLAGIWWRHPATLPASA